MRFVNEYAVYKGDEFLVLGTAEECAKQLNVSADYIKWLTMPTAKRRVEKSKNPEKCMVAIRLEDEEEEVS
ncbi:MULTISPECIES: hypothetical protein [Alkalihalophilus]|uniref:Uncharacterized protein n=1 Tax=Alkalihalophilus pseudofirmus (strain ATCC BAA-2126 / JCM 17055 / OF4) TaxID=398511 RepID=D3G1E5_ALKPO|nr:MULTISPECIES: hypothetical protein [Alkalihalophilus]ADC52171.1 hypothetical protein BpOF4_20879 [Alkalihalophilus pseudofirmus OF4]MEC2074192.1 hypothetical protein [Alkalihalophilus marmarensis]